MLILLPPSEGKSAPRRGKPLALDELSFPSLRDPRAEVLAALVTLCSGDQEKAASVLGLGSTQSDEVARNATLGTAPTATAGRVYSGVLYDALDLASLHGTARRRATRWIGIASGLFGLLRPGDRIPAYRLSGDVSLPGIGTVSSYWRAHLDDAVRSAAGSGLVVDLRSSTYASFWRPGPDLARRVVTVRVLHEQAGTRKVVSHFNKATKGRLIRSLLEQGSTVTSPGRFADDLRDLGWTIEARAPGPRGTQLDLVVSEL